jgi:hypothetical protein
MYQVMVTVSILVDDIRAGVSTLRRTIGLPEPRPQSYRAAPGLDAVFTRVHTKYAVAPTFLELISWGTQTAPDNGTDEFVSLIAAIAERQGSRAIKWHATELAMPSQELAGLADDLERRGIAIWFYPPDARDRFFVGGNPGAPDYDTSADGGLLIEAIPSEELGLPAEGLSSPADIPPGARPETMIRIVAREYLVSDLDATLAVFARNLHWAPTAVTEDDGCRRAVLEFSAPRSAKLELVQPAGRSRFSDAYDEHGPGAWTIRISVVDLEAKANDLHERGTPCSLERNVLRPDPAFTLHVPFEFVSS